MSIVPTGWMSEVKPAIGMVHLQPLPGSPGCESSLQAITSAALRNAEALIDGGMDGLLVENFGDAPFFPNQVPPITISCMATIASELRRAFDVPLGINVLRNDGRAALAVAAASGANFVRVNILTGARVTDQGIIEGQAHLLLRERKEMQAESVQIWADIQVKHSAPLAPRTLEQEVLDTIHRAHADALILSGSATGRSASLAHLSEVKNVAGDTPVLVGSGVDADNVRNWISLADGLIVGSALKEHGDVHAPVSREAVRRFVDALRCRTA